MNKLRDFMEENYYGNPDIEALPSGKEAQVYCIVDESNQYKFIEVIVAYTSDHEIFIRVMDVEDMAFKIFDNNDAESEKQALELGEEISEFITLENTISEIAEKFGLIMG